ncbi:hypothetical protein GCM10022236_43580 [Microlunatus ginsengisoli]|uniref:Uncharacterized protein n=1 Tax=Microlunatus ginsengisoli TaxID=363863 RepID=A0ABP7ANK4_9ACTN
MLSAAAVAWMRRRATWFGVAGPGPAVWAFMAGDDLSEGVPIGGRGSVAAVENLHGWGMG